MNLSFLSKKSTTNSRRFVEKAIAKNSATLCVTGRGPVLDWLLVLGVAGVMLCIFLWHGWYSYNVQSQKGFGPNEVEITEASSRTGVAEVLRFVAQRAAVAPLTTLPPVPPVPAATSSSSVETFEAGMFDAPVPGLR